MKRRVGWSLAVAGTLASMLLLAAMLVLGQDDGWRARQPWAESILVALGGALLPAAAVAIAGVALLRR